MTALTGYRTSVATKLETAGLKSSDYLQDAITPPCVVVIPGQPYIDWRPGSDAVPFGHFVVALDVLMLVPRGTAKTEAAAIDQMTATTVDVLDDYDTRRVSQPGVVELKGTKFIGAVLNLEITTKELG